MHSEMGPVRQNPIQRTVRTAHLSLLMTVHNFQYTQYSISPLLPPDNCKNADLEDDIYCLLSSVSWYGYVDQKKSCRWDALIIVSCMWCNPTCNSVQQ